MFSLFDLIAMHGSLRAGIGLVFFLAAVGLKWFLAKVETPSQPPCTKVSQSS